MIAKKNNINFISKSLRVVILFTIFLIPIIFSTKHLYYFTTIKYVFLALTGSICFALFSFYLFENKFVINQKQKIILILPGVVVIWVLISSIFGVNFENSFWSNLTRHMGFLTYFFCLIFFVSSLFVFNKETIYAPLKAFALGGMLAAISAYFAGAFFDMDIFFLKNSSNAGTLGNTTFAGIFLIFSLFATLIVFLNEKKKSQKWFYFSCFLIMFFSPIFLNTKNIFTGNVSNILSFFGEARAGLISIFLGLVFSLILYFYFHSKKIYSTLSKILLVSIFIVGVYGAVSLFDRESRVHRIFVDVVGESRFIYWEMALDGVGEKPIFGFGPENFPTIYIKYYNPILLSPGYPDGPWTDKPHNNILEFASSTGLPGLALYLLFIGFILITLIRKASMSDDKSRQVVSLFFGLILAYLFQAYFAFDTILSIFSLFVIVALISIYCFGEPEYVNKREMKEYIKWAVIVILGLFSILMIFFFSFKINQKSKMFRKMSSLSVENRILTLGKAMDMSPAGAVNESQYIDLTVSLYKNNWPKYTPEIRVRAKKELEYMFIYSGKKSDENPLDLRWALMSSRIGNMLFEMSSTKDISILEISKKYALKAIFIVPLGHMGYLSMTESLILEGKFDQAMKFAEMVVNINDKVPEFHNLVIYVAKLKKDSKLMEEKIRIAKETIPNYEYKP